MHNYIYMYVLQVQHKQSRTYALTPSRKNLLGEVVVMQQLYNAGMIEVSDATS